MHQGKVSVRLSPVGLTHDQSSPVQATSRFELFLYRLGKYREVVEWVDRTRARSLTGVSLATASLASPWMLLNFCMPHFPSSVTDAELILSGMSLHRLGEPDRAARVLDELRPKRDHPLFERMLLDEAFQLTGYPKWKGNKTPKSP